MGMNLITDDSDVPRTTHDKCTKFVYKYFSVYIRWKVILMVYFYINVSNTIICTCIYTMYEHTVIHIIASNADLFHYFLWVYYF
jgi:hypothetical protein